MSNIATPDHCVADFCLVPVSLSKPCESHILLTLPQMGTSSPSVSDQVADVHRMIETCGLKYVMHSAGTTLGTYGVHVSRL
jgi:hypothetical protein